MSEPQLVNTPSRAGGIEGVANSVAAVQARGAMGAEDRAGASSLLGGGTAGVNPYAAPATDLEDHGSPTGTGNERPELYVVAPQKFYLLSVFTVGFYTLYWFFARFRGQRLSGMKTNPALAALFSLFTAYRLFKRLDRAATRAGLESPPRAINQAAPYIALVVLGQLLRIFGEHSQALTALSLLLFVATALPLGRVQTLVNRLAGDPHGQSNAKLSALNLVSIAGGVIFWLLVLAGLVLAPRI